MASERELSQVLSEFARTMVTDFPIQGILDSLVGRIVDILPITAAGVTLISPGVEPHYIAASNEAALRFELLQTELGEGPCVAAYHSNEAVSMADLRDDGRFPTFTSRALEAGLAAVFTFPLRHGNHQLGALDLYRDSPGELSAESMVAAQTLADVTTAYLVNAQARADLEESSHRSRELSLHDPLTGLANRVLLMERLEHSLLRSRRSGLTSAVFFVDLDRFKNINDSFGHGVGDEVLVTVAERLCAVLRPGDTVARLSGDEFVVLCEDFATEAQAEVIVGRIDAALTRPLVLSGGVEVTVKASVGIAFTGRDVGADDVVAAADRAMYRAKRDGGARHAVLDLRDQHVANFQVGLERDLQGLLGRDELSLDYQAIVATADGSIVGFEALLRWAHPRRGIVAPNVLVPLAERAGLIPAIGQWVLEVASAQHDRWNKAYRPGDLTMSVNVSATQLMVGGFADMVAAVLRASHSPPEQLILEITESVLVQDAQRATIILNDLKSLGVKLALDDFGTGYSSLSYLLELPVDIVKIDRVFTAGLGHDGANHANHAIVTAIIHLAHDLGLTVTAEGVETAEQHEELTQLGCDSCQGYYFARPMAAAGIDTFIDRGVGATLPRPAVADITAGLS